MQKQSQKSAKLVQSSQPERRKMLITLAVVGVIALASGIASAVYFWPPKSKNGQQTVTQSHRTYSLNLHTSAYQANQPTELTFDIRDENNNVLKDFDTVHEKLLHLIVVRKDRSYFQHVHPNFDKASGMFTLTGFKFPTDGEYRVFADFTASSAQMGPDGMKLTATPYRDLKVGSGSYAAQPLGGDNMTSTANGLVTTMSLMGDDTPTPQPYATLPLTLGITIDKDGAAYKNLQPYLGALGHMVVLGPNLEYIHAHALDEATIAQTGLIAFHVTFPDPGQYKLYLQTQADGQVNTTDYTYTVKPMPSSSSNSNDSMPGMDHMGH